MGKRSRTVLTNGSRNSGTKMVFQNIPRLVKMGESFIPPPASLDMGHPGKGMILGKVALYKTTTTVSTSLQGIWGMHHHVYQPSCTNHPVLQVLPLVHFYILLCMKAFITLSLNQTSFQKYYFS